MAINILSNTNTSASTATDIPSVALKSNAEPDYDNYRLSGQAEVHFDHIVERFQNDSDWSQNKDVRQLLGVMAKDENFQAHMEAKSFQLKDPASVDPDAAINQDLRIAGREDSKPTPHEKLLLALLRNPENKTELELNDLTALLREELKTHPQKYAVLLTRAIHSEMTQHVEMKNMQPLTAESKARIGKLLKA